MKAAIVKNKGETPVYDDVDAPIEQEGYFLINVEASALSQLARVRAAGTHYSSPKQYPFIAGIDGVGRLENGQRVYFLLPEAPWGGMSEQTLVPITHCINVPESLDAALAAAIANPGFSSWAALTRQAKIQVGDTVLINGATGTSGTLAVPIAKHLGASKVIVTGRNLEKLEQLRQQGADEVIPLDKLAEELPRLFNEGIDIVLDYLWGESATVILNGAINVESDPIRFVQIGSISGDAIQLSSKILRSSSLILIGSGLGSVSLEDLVTCVGELLFATAEKGFNLPYQTVPLSQLAHVWHDGGSDIRTVFLVS